MLNIQVKVLGAKAEEYQGAKFSTLTVRTQDGTVGIFSGRGDFDFAPFLDQEVILELEPRLKNGRFGVRAISAKKAAK